MSFIPVPNVIKLEVVYVIGTSQQVNVYHVTTAGPIDLTKVQAAVNVLQTWVAGETGALISNTARLAYIKGTDLTEENSFYYLFTPTDNTYDGTRPSPILPSNVTMAVKHLTGRAGRSYRGRTYVIGLCEDQVTGDSVADTTVNGWIAAFQELQTSFSEASMAWVVVSYTHNKIPRAQGEANLIISHGSDGIVDSQRRRLAGRGI